MKQNTALAALRHHVSGKIERGEAVAIQEIIPDALAELLRPTLEREAREAMKEERK
jgi:hypothetical protein